MERFRLDADRHAKRDADGHPNDHAAASGAEFGAGFGAAKVGPLGAKFKPSFTNDEIKAEFARQSLTDQSGLNLSAPDLSSANFRVGGLLPVVNSLLTEGSFGGRAITLGTSMSLMPSNRSDLATLAHELRHVGQLQALGLAGFYGRYAYESATRLDRFYLPGNTTLEPYYGR